MGFEQEIDKTLKGKMPSNSQLKAKNNTPKILVDYGIKDLPMLITQKHVRQIIYTKIEAKKLGYKTKNINYHGLGKELLVKSINNLDNPKAIYNVNENNYLIITEFLDNKGKEIVIPIQIEAKGLYNNVYIKENQIKSVYGRNNLKRYLQKNKFRQIYKKKHLP